jgi:hypothetical protein|tara:strand:+ start:693 stop:974 length:282 start_codon:yes stop_codon:yes gene_type:complete
MAWKDLKKEKPKIANSIDGYVRSEEDDLILNKHFANVFKGDEGKKVLDYLKSITIEAVAGPNIDGNRLFHLEGMRFLVGIINTRIKKGENDGR